MFQFNNKMNEIDTCRKISILILVIGSKTIGTASEKEHEKKENAHVMVCSYLCIIQRARIILLGICNM